MNIIDSTIEKLEDPFSILTGDRYEIFLTLDIDEEDELYSENGIRLKLIFAVEAEKTKIAQYDFIEKTTDRFLDFALEEEEEKEVEQYCQQLVEQL
ncbi:MULTISPECIES: DUF6509 family protein [Metabacillus]|uniref:Pullulanase n=2 Tax=Metabacillus TaxID=2675233 RepID=A0A179T0L0_9BACI|nr:MULTISPECIES: DUF6509 family protein [Metabacillus]OAS86609.1 pullulanase [Metabacillus litoralis]QNF29318.1 pullulanase [Metabacillus sp. KUDC1714]